MVIGCIGQGNNGIRTWKLHDIIAMFIENVCTLYRFSAVPNHGNAYSMRYSVFYIPKI